MQKAETELDVFNVNVARQQAEVEIDRKGLTRLEDQPQGWVAWGKSWFGGGGSTSEQKKGNAGDIASKFQVQNIVYFISLTNKVWINFDKGVQSVCMKIVS